jgi:hypothetical protein
MHKNRVEWDTTTTSERYQAPVPIDHPNGRFREAVLTAPRRISRGARQAKLGHKLPSVVTFPFRDERSYRCLLSPLFRCPLRDLA